MMKWTWAMVGTMALAACSGGQDDAGTTGQSQAAPLVTPAPSNLAGTYGAAGVDGQPWTSSLNADGSYQNTIGGEVSEAGTWTQAEDQLCFSPEAAPDEAAREQTCLTVLSVNQDGSLVLADAQGNQTTAPRIDRQD